MESTAAASLDEWKTFFQLGRIAHGGPAGMSARGRGHLSGARSHVSMGEQ
jgi:hypothetical protein